MDRVCLSADVLDCTSAFFAQNAKEAFESDNLEEIDMSELTLAILKINDAYNQPLTDYKVEKMRVAMSSMQTDKIAALANSASTIANIQGNANA